MHRFNQVSGSLLAICVLLAFSAGTARAFDSGVLDFEDLSQGDAIAGHTFTGGHWRAGGRTLDGVRPLTPHVVVRSIEQTKSNGGWGRYPNSTGHANVLVPATEPAAGPGGDRALGARIFLDDPITATDSDGMHKIEFDLYFTDDFMQALGLYIGQSPYECCQGGQGFLGSNHTNAFVRFKSVHSFSPGQHFPDAVAKTHDIDGSEVNFNRGIADFSALVDFNPLTWHKVELYMDLTGSRNGPSDFDSHLAVGDASYHFFMDGVYQFTGDFVDAAEGLAGGIMAPDGVEVMDEFQTIGFDHNANSEFPGVFIDNVRIQPGTPAVPPTVSPEPATLALLSLGGLALLAGGRGRGRGLPLLLVCVLVFGLAGQAWAYDSGLLDFEDLNLGDPIAGHTFNGGHWRVAGRHINMGDADLSGYGYDTEIEKVVIVDDPINPGNNVLSPSVAGGTTLPGNGLAGFILDEHIGVGDETHVIEFDLLLTDDTDRSLGILVNYNRDALNAARGWYDFCGGSAFCFRGTGTNGLGQNWKANGEDSINYTAEDPAIHYVDGSNIDDVAPFDITPNQWMHVEYAIDLKGENNGFNGDATYDMYIDNQLVLTGEYHDATEQGERMSIPRGPVRLLSRFQEVRFEHGTSSPLAVFIDNVRVQPFTPPVVQPVDCDFNSDTVCNDVDIDLLAAAVREASSDLQFNVDGLGDPNIPDDADFDFYITDESMLGTGLGDHDLNMIVNFNDFVVLSNNFNTSPTGWAQGNGNTDDTTNFNDFVRLSNNFGLSFASGSNVPEPAALGLLGIGCLLAVRRRRP